MMPKATPVRLIVTALALATAGCARFRDPPSPPPPNPAVFPLINQDLFWDQLVDVVDDYFQIDREDRVRQVGDVLTEGRIDTYPQVGATLFEPWLQDTVDGYERLESTLQTIRRRAVVRVTPSPEGYEVDVQVFKELEDLPQPERSSAGAAAFRNDPSPKRFSEPVGGQQTPLGWIGLGRDAVLEQEILWHLQTQLQTPQDQPWWRR